MIELTPMSRFVSETGENVTLSGNGDIDRARHALIETMLAGERACIVIEDGPAARRAILDRLALLLPDSGFRVVRVAQRREDPFDLRSLMDQVAGPDRHDGIDSVERFYTALTRPEAGETRLAVLVDDAHRLTGQALQYLDLFASTAEATPLPMQLVLAGSAELLDRLPRTSLAVAEVTRVSWLDAPSAALASAGSLPPRAEPPVPPHRGAQSARRRLALAGLAVVVTVGGVAAPGFTDRPPEATGLARVADIDKAAPADVALATVGRAVALPVPPPVAAPAAEPPAAAAAAAAEASASPGTAAAAAVLVSAASGPATETQAVAAPGASVPAPDRSPAPVEPTGGGASSASAADAPAIARPAEPKVQVPVVLPVLLARGAALLANGDVAAARLMYERAAASNAGSAAIALGMTYDPRFLAEIGAAGIQPDPQRARAWYRRAVDLGSAAEATPLLVQLESARGH